MDICGDCSEEISPYFTHQCKGPQVGLFDPVADAGRLFEAVKGATGNPPLPPHVAGSDTSKAAAESMRGRAQTDQARVLQYITDQGVEGATADECLVALDLSHQNGSARVSTLAQCGAIEDSLGRRKTRAKRLAVVYVATGKPATQPVPRKPPPTQPSSEDIEGFIWLVRLTFDAQGAEPSEATDRVMLWLKHLGEQ